MSFFIFKCTEESYQAIGQSNGYEYIIKYTEHEELIKILDNLKG